MKKYVLLAGVNGAGKSTLFSLISSIGNIEKVNLDDTVRKLGDWRDVKAVTQAGKIVIKQINDCFSKGVSFSQETTLCGKNIIKNIQRAKKLGYYVEIHYVGLNSADIAKLRVKSRVAKGGHGIPDADIERRYNESMANIKTVFSLCDMVVFYDNTKEFSRFAVFKNRKCVDILKELPEWYRNMNLQ
jgi:predicted ABC-type ATPase